MTVKLENKGTMYSHKGHWDIYLQAQEMIFSHDYLYPQAY